MKKCKECSRYTFRDECPECGSQTGNPEPPKFSPEDPYGEYRRRAKDL